MKLIPSLTFIPNSTVNIRRMLHTFKRLPQLWFPHTMLLLLHWDRNDLYLQNLNLSLRNVPFNIFVGTIERENFHRLRNHMVEFSPQDHTYDNTVFFLGTIPCFIREESHYYRQEQRLTEPWACVAHTCWGALLPAVIKVETSSLPLCSLHLNRRLWPWTSKGKSVGRGTKPTHTPECGFVQTWRVDSTEQSLTFSFPKSFEMFCLLLWGFVFIMCLAWISTLKR